MELGERICALRTARGLSQSDLADALEVSRQSISKWETGASVPELDKLLKLSELFGLTLDELVTGKTTKAPAEEPPEAAQAPAPPKRSHGQTVAGIILLCFAGLVWLVLTVIGGFLEGLILALPFALCGLICLFVRRRAGLWCAWAVSILVDLYLCLATGIRWGMIFYTFRWEEWMNYIRLAMAWGMFAELAVLISATALCYRREPMARTRQNLTLLIVGAAALVVLWAAQFLPIWNWAPYWLTSYALQWVRAGLLAAVLTGLVRFRGGGT